MKLNVKDTMNSNIKKQLIYGAISLVGNLLGYYFIGLLGTRCLYNFKKNYFNVILSQEQGWFDSTNVFEFATKIQAQLEYIELGLGEGFGRILIDTFIGIGSFIFAFFGSWKLTLVVLCLTPLVVLFGIIMNKQNVKGNTLVRGTWEIAGGIGEEIFFNINIIASFANFDYELKRFYEKVEISNKIELLVNIKVRLYNAILVFLGNLVVFITFIYGRTLVEKDYNYLRGRDMTGGDFTLTYNTIVAFFTAIISIFTNLQNIQVSLAAISDYFNLYERKPQMDLTSSVEKPDLVNIKGEIEFNNVNFYYPTDIKKTLVLNRINLSLNLGKK